MYLQLQGNLSLTLHSNCLSQMGFHLSFIHYRKQQKATQFFSLNSTFLCAGLLVCFPSLIFSVGLIKATKLRKGWSCLWIFH